MSSTAYDSQSCVDARDQLHGKPKVSIGLVAYNDEAYIGRVFQDLLAQTYGDFELIVSDDASEDGTEAICRARAEADSRIRFVRQPANLGMQGNYTYVLQEARGEYFMWASSDDRWAPDFLCTLVQCLDEDPGLASAFCPFHFIDEHDLPVSGPYGGVFVDEYSGSSALVRLARFCWRYRDGAFYGLHRTERIRDVVFPIWWWVNSKVATNNNYPVLVHILCRGDHVIAGTQPLFFKRLHLRTVRTRPRHSRTFFHRPFAEFPAFLLRKVNVLWASTAAVYRASQSILLTVLAVPLFAARAAYDCVEHALDRVKRVVALTRRLAPQ